MKFNKRRFILIIVDVLIIFGSCMFTRFVLKDLGTNLKPVKDDIFNMFLYIAMIIIMMYVVGAYRNLWSYAQIKDFDKCFIGMAAGYLISIMLSYSFKIFQANDIFIRPIYITISSFVSFCGIVLVRVCYSWGFAYMKRRNGTNTGKPTLIVGAGSGAERLLAEMLTSDSGYKPIAIVDDDKRKLHNTLHGVEIMGTTNDIPKVCSENGIKLIIIAIPSIGKDEKKRIISIASSTECAIKALPHIYDIIDTGNLMKQVQAIDFNDLLGREPIKFDDMKIKSLISGAVCMITGGGGSIGSELCRQVASYGPKQLIIVDIYENNAYDIQQELVRKYGDTLDLHVEIASVRDYAKLDLIFHTYHPQIVCHAAAHKHVPLMEVNPEEAVKNNIFGTYNTATLSELYKVEKFIMISTDKAVNPTNVMGATKRCCEMIVQDMAQKSKHTKFITVRFGNVLGSNGSVIPLFEKQIAAGGPVTVTHPDIIRYFMTIPEAVSLILQASANANGGEIFVLDMGEPVKILTLAENLIRMHGKEPYEDIDIQFTGLRPGEKLYEELLMDEEGLSKTDNNRIFVGQQIKVDEHELFENLDTIKRMSNSNDKELVVEMLAKMVPTFHHKVN